MSNVLPQYRAEIERLQAVNASAERERNHIAQHVWSLLTDVRAGRASLVEERLSHIAFLLDRPGWHNGAEANLMEAAE